jgi:hypothetical protein
MPSISPGDLEVYGCFSKHLGPRFMKMLLLAGSIP